MPSITLMTPTMHWGQRCPKGKMPHFSTSVCLCVIFFFVKHVVHVSVVTVLLVLLVWDEWTRPPREPVSAVADELMS